jgi:hypothetical protein
MKNFYFFLFLYLGSITKAHASAGNASDGLMFSLTIIGLLLVLAGVLFLLDFFKGKGIQIIQRSVSQFVSQLIRYFKNIRLFLIGIPGKVLQP